jgi:GPH family glycoside/pentoside/hexuronide:cation symporter
MNTLSARHTAFTWQQGWRYGLMGLPLAFVALPLYVMLPNHYARSFGMPLATLGAVLLGARLFDAFIDPLLGRWSDRLFKQSTDTVLRWAAAAALALGAGFALLFFPQVSASSALMVWLVVSLAGTYVAYSALSILHQSWGARLGGDEVQRSRVVAWREGLGLAGVILASISPLALGLPASVALFSVALLLGWLAWRNALVPAPAHSPDPGAGGPQTGAERSMAGARPASLTLPFTRPAFRALLAVFMVNGIASAVPATLLLFFVQDRLQAAPEWEPLFLGSYFVSAALAIPLWLRLVPRLGLARTWGVGMLLSVAVFVFAASLGAGDSVAFLVVCALSGAALGTDLALPGALLAGTIADSGDRGHAEGAYFGWWNFATKLNLALAAGVALPLLATLGYVPGTHDAHALQTLSLAYCVLPCALKLLAAFLLYLLFLRKTT